MNIEAVSNTVETPRPSLSSEQISRGRKQLEKDPENLVSTDSTQQKVQPEELLKQIKAITDNGLYSVQFENDNKNNQLIVKVIDRETNEVIRQIPPEDLLALTKHLNELQGNLVDTVG